MLSDSQPKNAKKIAYLKASSLEKLPHILFFVISSKTPRTTCGEVGEQSKTEDRNGLRAKSVDFPQKVFHSDGLVSCSVGASIEQLTINHRMSAEPAPGDFSESLVFVGFSRSYSLNNGPTCSE